MAEDMVDSVVVDLGSSTIKAGYSNNDAPRAVFQNIYGFLNRPAVMVGNNCNDYYVGDTAQLIRGRLTLRHPMERGIVTDWTAMQQVMHHTLYNEMNAGDMYPTLLTERPFTPTAQREKFCSMLMETYSVPSVSFAMPEVLAVWASGRNTALVVDVGHGVTTIVPVVNGFIIRSGVIRADFSGADLTEYLQRMLTEKGCYFTTTQETEIVRDMKEKLCYVALDYESELQASLCSTQLNKIYEMPDGNVITLGSERFRCPEALFQPSLMGKEFPGIHHLIETSLNHVELTLRQTLMSNIVLSGGTTMLPGFADRLHKELKNLVPPNASFKIIAAPERKYFSWIGGSLVTSLSSMSNMWFTKEEYDEHGPSYSRIKCPYL